MKDSENNPGKRRIRALIPILAISIIGGLLLFGNQSSNKLDSPKSSMDIPSAKGESVTDENLIVVDSSALAQSLAKEGHTENDIQRLLNTEYCYNQGGKAVTQNFGDELEASEIDEQVNDWQMEYLALLKNARPILSASSDPQHLLTLALLENKPQAARAALIKALEIEPDSAQLLSARAVQCRSKQHKNCNAFAAAYAWLKHDPQNAEAWHNLSALQYEKGDIEDALQSLSGAANASNSEQYFWDNTLAIERGLNALGKPFNERLFAATSAAVIAMPSTSSRFSMCREQATKSSHWAEACFAAGETAERNDNTMIGHGIGLGLQRAVAENIRDSKRGQAAILRHEKNERKFGVAVGEIQENLDNEYYLSNKPKLWYDYIEHARQNDEYSAMQFLRESVIELRAEGWQSPCERLRRRKAETAATNP